MSARPSPASLPHADLGTPGEMATDCAEVGRHLHLERVARAAVTDAPSIRFEDYPREVAKPQIRVSDAAARLAGALFG